jgi:16S rRNA (guanine527-N7)-methyltransferase
VWAIVRPDLEVICVEPLLRRVNFLTEAITRLNLTNRVQVRRGRAEDLAGEIQAPVVTARAVAPLERLVGWTMPLVAPGGELLALKGAAAEAEVAAAEKTIARMGGDRVEVSEWGHGMVDPPTRVVRIHKSNTWR